MSSGRTIAAVLAVLFAGATPVLAQTSGYQTNFDNATGWTLSAGVNGVKWNVDGTPSTMTGGAYKSSAASLNFNNGTTFNSGSSSVSSGTATSGAITLSGSSPTLTFWCNFKTEAGATSATYGYDKRLITLTPGSGSPVTKQFGVTGADPLVGPCSAMGTWHQHTIALQSSWGTVKIEFKFDSVDAYDNSHPGWFIDDLQVTGGGAGNNGGTVSTVKEWNFDNGLENWTSTSSNATVKWAADATPSSVTGGAFKSAPNSLNYNNGTNYDASGTTNNGTATSPDQSLSGLSSPTLTFWCNFQTESSASYDKRFVQISKDNFTTTLLDVQLKTTGTSGGVGDCAASGTWHTHTVTLDPSWGTVKFRFKFDTVDGYANTYAGWFVDDVKVQAVGGAVGGSLEDPNAGVDQGGPPKRHWCGSSVAETGRPVFGLGFAGFFLALAILLLLLRRLRQSP